MRRLVLVLVGLLAFSATSPALLAGLRLPHLFGDHMVLQRSSLSPLWGWDRPGQIVRIRVPWRSKDIITIADRSGYFRASIPTPDQGPPATIEILGSETIALKDVLLGEVWVCSGQSNMEWRMTDTGPDYAKDIDEANYPDIRLFDVKNTISLVPKEDCDGQWRACTPDSARSFSAVGYHFGRALHLDLKVPVGLIGANWGGTRVEAWTSEGGLSPFPFEALDLAKVRLSRIAPGELERRHRVELAAWWDGFKRIDPGTSEGAFGGQSFDDSSWPEATLPCRFSDHGLSSFDGVCWYRRHIDIPSEWVGQDLELTLGPIDDMDRTWVNGHQVGGYETEGHWQTKRRYEIPASLVQETQLVIAVRVLDTGGVGGLNGQASELALSLRGQEEAPLSLAGPWRFQKGAPVGRLGSRPRSSWFHANTATALFNGMIAPIVPFGIRGAIWYQGESNVSKADRYRTLFPNMIEDWRRHWDRGDFPFYFVQIAPFAYGGDRGQAAELREAQRLSLKTVNTGMAVTMDIGDPRDIHPQNKVDVGKRLARWALAKTYGREGLVYSGPLYDSMSVEGDRIRLRFSHVGGGLRSKQGALTHFSIAGEDRKFVAADATIDGESILVRSSQVPNPVAVRFGWGAADEPNLFNAEGLPASSFRTDDWPMITADPR